MSLFNLCTFGVHRWALWSDIDIHEGKFRQWRWCTRCRCVDYREVEQR